MREWFKARNIWGAAIETLSDAEAGRLMKALWKYTMSGEQANLSGAEKGIFALILMTLNQDEEQANDISKKRAEAGAIGGKQRVANQANANFASDEQANQANALIRNKNKEKEKDKDNKENNKRFTPPSLEEVTSYCLERGNGINAQTFIDFYSSKGWRVGNQPMKDWKACIRTWEQRDRKPSKTVSAQNYEQRDYSGEQDEAMKRMLKAMQEGA